jgi:hypothetical protein
VGLSLPAGLAPGEPADRLRDVVRDRPVAVPIEWGSRRETVRDELQVAAGRRLTPWLPWSGDPKARTLALAQLAAGLPLTAWGLRHRSGGWLAAGTLLLAHGALGVLYDLSLPAADPRA